MTPRPQPSARPCRAAERHSPRRRLTSANLLCSGPTSGSILSNAKSSLPGRCTGEPLRIECHAAWATSAVRRAAAPRSLTRVGRGLSSAIGLSSAVFGRHLVGGDSQSTEIWGGMFTGGPWGIGAGRPGASRRRMLGSKAARRIWSMIRTAKGQSERGGPAFGLDRSLEDAKQPACSVEPIKHL